MQCSNTEDAETTTSLSQRHYEDSSSKVRDCVINDESKSMQVLLAREITSFLRRPSAMAREQDEERETSIPCAAEEFCDARVTGREETMRIIERLTSQFLEDIANGRAPELYLVRIARAHTLTLQLCVQ